MLLEKHKKYTMFRLMNMNIDFVLACFFICLVYSENFFFVFGEVKFCNKFICQLCAFLHDHTAQRVHKVNNNFRFVVYLGNGSIYRWEMRMQLSNKIRSVIPKWLSLCVLVLCYYYYCDFRIYGISFVTIWLFRIPLSTASLTRKK